MIQGKGFYSFTVFFVAVRLLRFLGLGDKPNYLCHTTFLKILGIRILSTDKTGVVFKRVN